MSPENRGVFELMKSGTWSLHCGVLIVIVHKALQASSSACGYFIWSYGYSIIRKIEPVSWWSHSPLTSAMSPKNSGIFQLMKRVTWGIVPGLKLLLFSSPKRSNSWTFQRAFLLYSSVLQRSYARLTSANCLGNKISGQFKVNVVRFWCRTEIIMFFNRVNGKCQVKLCK